MTKRFKKYKFTVKPCSDCGRIFWCRNEKTGEFTNECTNCSTPEFCVAGLHFRNLPNYICVVPSKVKCNYCQSKERG